MDGLADFFTEPSGEAAEGEGGFGAIGAVVGNQVAGVFAHEFLFDAELHGSGRCPVLKC